MLEIIHINLHAKLKKHLMFLKIFKKYVKYM